VGFFFDLQHQFDQCDGLLFGWDQYATGQGSRASE
jgi:hypothetical protein